MRISCFPVLVLSFILQLHHCEASRLRKCPGSYPSNVQSDTLTVYHDVDRLSACKETMLLDFALYNALDDPATHISIRATVGKSFGKDSAIPLPICDSSEAIQEKVNAELAWWGEADMEHQSQVVAASRRVQDFLQDGANCNAKSIFSYSNGSAVGVFSGANIQNKGAASTMVQAFIDQLQKDSHQRTLIQYCGPNSAHILGIISDYGLNSLSEVQKVVRKWSDGECVIGYDGSSAVKGSTIWTIPVKGPQISVIANSSVEFQQLFQGTHQIKLENEAAPKNAEQQLLDKQAAPEELKGKSMGDIKQLATTCSTVQVVSGDSCGSLANKCGISGAQFTAFNPSPNLCSTLAVGQFVCCSAGSLPDLSPKPNPDGSCATFVVNSGDYCAKIASENSITVAQIEAFNSQTWGWMGCNDLQLGQTICLSSGFSPLPSPDPNAVCGPAVPGTTTPSISTALGLLNPCPLNACCDIWGQCGTVAEFCTDTRAPVGAPGTAAPGTNGCISNCGVAIVNNQTPPSKFRNVGYFEAWGVTRPCLAMDASQIDVTKYTHIHFAFAGVTPDFNVDVSGVQDQFTKFIRLKNVLRILSFGGWSFSTSADTAPIFRNGVTDAQRGTFATNVAAFVMANNLDGVDFDWEYPGATDIPGAPPGSPQDGANYLAFLKVLRTKLPAGKTISIAAPASFWYLKGFPISDIGKVVEYIIFMTYDLHGQWDCGSAWSDSGCPSGNCLQSHVNLTETMNALSMITKAGVPSNKVVVGVTSYGRSFQMTTKGCWGPHCTFTGPDSGATPGLCTQTAGYISDAEIYQIIANDLIAQQFTDGSTDTSILVYNDTQWVAYMSKDSKASRTKQYQSLNFGGTSDWAIDLEDFVTSTPAITFQPCTATFPDLPTLMNAINTLQVPSHCINIYFLNYLANFLGNSLQTYQNYLNNDYDRKFTVFQGYIQSQVATEISDYMSVNASKFFTCTKTENIECCKDCTTDGCQGCDHRNPCTSGIQNTPYPCPNKIPNNPLYLPNEDWQYTCTNTAAFYADLLNIYGMSPGWIKLGSLYAGIETGCRAIGCHQYAFTGFPVIDNITVSNPKDNMVSAQANLKFLHNVLLDSSLNAQFFLYGGQIIDPVLSTIVPAYTLDYVVRNMQNIMNEADQISEAQRKAEIAAWVGCALMCVPIGGEFLGELELATAKAILDIAGTAADISWSIYNVVQSPSSWYTLLFTLIIDLPVAANFGKTFEKAAKIFKAMDKSQLAFWGPLASDEIQSIISGRPATCNALNS